MQKIISWNVASVRARMPALEKLLKQEQPDVVLLQEIKAEQDTFPFLELQGLGYHCAISGQKSYNGVAILSKEPLTAVQTALPDFQDTEQPQARFVQATLPSGQKVISVYVPNGNPLEKDPENKEKLAYKLKWMAALNKYVNQLLSSGEKIILGGDFNVIEKDTDVYNPEAYRTNALMVDSVREKYAELNALPLINAIRLMNPEPHTYSFWDFQMRAWPLNRGMLLDALFVNSSMKQQVSNAGILKQVRGWEKTSDHAPVFLMLD